MATPYISHLVPSQTLRRLSWAIFLLSTVPVASLVSASVLAWSGVLDAHSGGAWPQLINLFSAGTTLALTHPAVLIAALVISHKFQPQPRRYKLLLFSSLLITTLDSIVLAVALLFAALR